MSFKQELLQALLNAKPLNFGSYTLGQVTEMTCRCGGFLQSARPSIKERPPKHRQKRIAKKLRKKWVEEGGLTRALLLPLARPFFVCVACGKHESLTTACAKNMFVVEKLPEGALPIYTKAPEGE